MSVPSRPRRAGAGLGGGGRCVSDDYKACVVSCLVAAPLVVEPAAGHTFPAIAIPLDNQGRLGALCAKPDLIKIRSERFVSKMKVALYRHPYF